MKYLPICLAFLYAASLGAVCTYGDPVQTRDYPVGILLTWTTDSEQNNDRFQVQFSTDGADFQNIGTVEGNGTTQFASKYQYLHTNPRTERLFYRLQQIDADGSFAYTDVVVHDARHAALPLTLLRVSDVFTNEALVLTCDAYAPGSFRYVVKNLDGQPLLQHPLQLSEAGVQEIRVPLEALTDGTYRLEVRQREVVCARLTFRKVPQTAADGAKEVPVARRN